MAPRMTSIGALLTNPAEHEGVGSGLFELLRHFDALLRLHALPEAVVHVDLDYDSHVVASGFHDLFHHELHEAHAVLETAAELVLAVVRVG